MSPLSEQFSEARKLQLDTQLNFFRSFTGKAFESAEKLIALNLDASRASLEQSSNLVRQMIAAKDPRDLFALTNQTQSQLDSVLSYGRQLFGIAAGAATVAVPGAQSAAASAPAPASAAPAPEAVAQKAKAAAPVAEPAPEVMPAPVVEIETALVVEAKPVVEARPIAEQNPVAKAVGNHETLKPSAASFPVPSSAQPIAVAPVQPVEAIAPPAPASGGPSVVTKKAAAPAAPATKAARKK
ncbi:MAG: phasin family domain protein [Massilia sp.]|jgi:phasin family protein|nr:phasin family domain protein [Massilia sp.]MDB5951398.1 phasin family domain protein [Massilia sp.]